MPEKPGVWVTFTENAFPRICWDPADARQVATAREMYETMIARHCRAYRPNSERLLEFDPAARVIVFDTD